MIRHSEQILLKEGEWSLLAGEAGILVPSDR